MKKKTLLPIFILVIVAVSSTYAYTNFCDIKNSQVYISSSNVTISDSTVSIGNNVTFVNPPNSIAPTIKHKRQSKLHQH